MKGSVGMKTWGAFSICWMKAKSSSGGAIVFFTSLMGKGLISGSGTIAGSQLCGFRVSVELSL